MLSIFSFPSHNLQSHIKTQFFLPLPEATKNVSHLPSPPVTVLLFDWSQLVYKVEAEFHHSCFAGLEHQCLTFVQLSGYILNLETKPSHVEVCN